MGDLAKEAVADPFKHKKAPRKRVMADVDLGKVRLRGKRLSQSFRRAITGGEIARGIGGEDGVTTLSFEVHDPHWELLRSPLFEKNEPVSLRVDTLDFEFVGMSIPEG